MIPARLLTGLVTIAWIAALVKPAAADTYKVILRGKVVMADGSAPPTTVGIQRICSDSYGDAPGPITDKKGAFIWQMDFDNMLTRACRLQAELKGYSSSAIDISDVNGFLSSDKVLPPIVLYVKGSDPRVIREDTDDVPGPAKGAWREVLKALGTGNVQEITEHLKMVVAAAPKFARGWDSLGIGYETLQMSAEARDAYIHATELDPKMTVAFVTLSREDVLTKDWQGAVNAANAAIKLDLKKMYPEVYLHRAAAELELKQLDAAEADAKKSLELNFQAAKFRGEFVMGQILAAKGDAAGAKTHISRYLELSKTPPDLDLIKAYLDALGTPNAGAVAIDPERP